MVQPNDDSGPPQAAGESALLTTGEMARLTHNTLRTVRFYEEEGILRPVRRTEGGHRLFDRPELERLLLVTDMREAGLSLDEIKSILAVKSRATNGADAAREATSILTKRMDELRDKLAVLARLQADLTQTAEIVSACRECKDPRFPTQCGSCTVMTSHPSLPRSLRVLWSTTSTRGASDAGEPPTEPEG